MEGVNGVGMIVVIVIIVLAWRLVSKTVDSKPSKSRTSKWESELGCGCKFELSSEFSSNQAMQKQEVIAWHEAAHARVARSKGKWPVYSMMANGHMQSGLTRFGADSRGGLEAYLLTCAAGQAGAMLYFMSKRGGDHSRRVAKRLSVEGTAGDKRQFAKAAHGTNHQWDDFVDRAFKIVKRQAYTIEQNAKPLARNGRRSGTWA